jgi:HK97 family phage major capsid protein/HK97 family phage prohead protease
MKMENLEPSGPGSETLVSIPEMKIGSLRRAFSFDRAAIDEASRTIALSFSSELPVERWFGSEILSHEQGSADLNRLNDGAPLLFNHDPDRIIGVVQTAMISNGRGVATVRFASTDAAQEMAAMVNDGIIRNVSFGYQILEMKEAPKGTFTATRWVPYEISLVSIPADPTVGVGRSDDQQETPMTKVIRELPAIEAETTPPSKKQDIKMDTTVEVTAAENAATAKERERISGISALARMFVGNDDLANTLIDSGKSLDEARAAFLEKIGARQKPITGEEAKIGMTSTELKQFSFARVINALANPTDRHMQDAAAFEFECSHAAQKTSKRQAQGIMIPYDVLHGQRDLTVTTAAEGGNTVATSLLASSFIDLLRSKMVVSGLGTQMLMGLTDFVAIPRQSSGASAFWVAEGVAPTESQQAFDQVTLAPKTLGAFTDFSRRLLLQSSIDVESFVKRDLASVIALEVDRAAIHGTGTAPQPRGIVATSGIGSVAGGTNGAAPTYANIVALETAVAVSNADIGSLAYLTNTRVRGLLKRTFVNTTGGETPVFTQDGMMNGYRAAVTNQVSNTLTKGTSVGNCSAIIFGNFSDLIIGMWGGLDLTVDPYTFSTSGTIRIVAMQDVDVAVRNAASFAAMLDALA